MSKSKKMPRLISGIRRDISRHPHYPALQNSSYLDFLFFPRTQYLPLRMKPRHILEPRKQNRLLRNVWKALYRGVKAIELAALIQPSPDSATWLAMPHDHRSAWCQERIKAYTVLLGKRRKH